MIKRVLELWERLRRNPGRLIATVRVDFYPNKTAAPVLVWHNGTGQDHDPVTLAIFFYARILYELAELNETRVAKELMAFLSQVVERMSTEQGPPKRMVLPMGELRVEEAPMEEPASRSYQADFYRLRDGQHRLEFQGSLGKEGVYLPATYVVLLQYFIDRLPDEPLRHLAMSLRRLHAYYKFRRDFWDSISLSAGPVFALGAEELRPEEVEMEE